jgi:hypothetical protein
MANASAITVTALTANTAGIAPPTADVLDTGTSAVTLPADVGGSGMVLFEFVSNHASAVNTTFAILAGDVLALLALCRWWFVPYHDTAQRAGTTPRHPPPYGRSPLEAAGANCQQPTPPHATTQGRQLR